MLTTKTPIYTTFALKKVTQKIIHLQALSQKSSIEFKKWRMETMRP